MLSADQIKAREGKLTASRVGILLSGDDQKIAQLYRQFIGEEAEENLDDVWAVQLGSCTEALNLRWYEKKNNPISRIGEVCVHPRYPMFACTLDAWDHVLRCPIECKHTGGREPMEILRERYAAQMAWQMACTGAKQVAFSVIMGAAEPIVDFVEYDVEYERDMIKAGLWFMECVSQRRPPVEMPVIASPIPAEQVYDMTGSNIWASEAAAYLETKEAADRCEDAKKILKSLVPLDAKKAHGHGVVITRNRVGNLSLREEKL